MDVPITEPLLLERLALDDEAFLAFYLQLLRDLPARTLTPALLKTALGYPWERPARSYLLDGEQVVLDGTLDRAGRFPLLAFGSNGAPAPLIRKLAHFPPEERRVLVHAGELHDFDVGSAAHPTVYGSMAATLFESPGTAVRAAVLWVTPAQFTQLSWTETSYRLGRLEGIRFTPDDGPLIDAVYAYAARWGTFAPGGEPLALAALPARGRRARACTQAELLGRAAALAGLPDAEALVRTMFEDLPALLAGPSAAIRAAGIPFAPTTWTPFAPAR